MPYTDLELKVLKMILDYKNSNFTILNEQLAFSRVLDRETDSAWFLSKILVDKSKARSINNSTEKIIFWDVWCDVSQKIYMWFLLYIENWYITLLEGYTYDDDFTQFDMQNYELVYEWWSNRNIPDELL